MNDKLFYMIFTNALGVADRDAFISDWALSSVWSDAKGAEIPADRLHELGMIWDVAHASFADIVAASGLKLVDFAARFAIPYRTVLSWKHGERECPDYTRLLLARAVGMY